MLAITEIQSKSDISAFIDFPHELYAADPFYVSELHIAINELLNKNKNPYFKHSDAKLYLAKRDGKIVGRIVSTVNNNYNEFHKCNVGFFGFFDCVEDLEVAKLLLDQAEKDIKEQGATAILGPTNLTTNDTAALLVDGFDGPPVVQLTYNKPYYLTLLTQLGYEKEMDMYAYYIPTSSVNDKSVRLANSLVTRLNNRGITFRNVQMKNFDSEIKGIKKIYQQAWEKNWGFVPPTDAEFDFLAEGLKMIIDPRYVHIAEENGEIIGFAVALPNINEILINVKKGRLFPTGIFKLLLGKKKTKIVRVILLGIIESHRKIGIEAVFFAKLITTAKADRKVAGEASWVLESNDMMMKAAEGLNGQKYRTYRILSKKL